jgi:hypothetical protein
MHTGEFTGPALCSGTAVTGSGASQVLAYSDRNRLGMMVFNHSSNAVFLKLGNAASVVDFTVKLSSGSYYELPLPIHTGSVTAIMDASGGHMMVTVLSRP